jgi:hypothetical protein
MLLNELGVYFSVFLQTKKFNVNMNYGSSKNYVWDSNTARGKIEHVPEKINAQLSIARVLELLPVVL